MTARPTKTTGTIAARCLGCPWAQDGNTAQGLAARHHDQTGHQVEVFIDRTIVYGDTTPIPGQTTLEEPTAA